MGSLEYGDDGQRYIAIDGGGTKTDCLLGDSRGRVLAVARGAGTNMKSRPWPEVAATLLELIGTVLERSRTERPQVALVLLGLAGAQQEEERQRVRVFLQEHLPEHAAIVIYNDGIVALAAGTWGKAGVVVIAGTGSIAQAFDPALGATVRAGGWGYLLGDGGSGYDMGRQALRALLLRRDGLDDEGLLGDEAYAGQATELELALFERLGISEAGELIDCVYGHPSARERIAGLARPVIELACTGNAAAASIVETAASQLAALAVSAVRRAQAAFGWDGDGADTDAGIGTGKPLPLIAAGGLFSHPYFFRRFEHRLLERAPSLRAEQLKLPPVIGAYALAISSVRSLDHTIQSRIIRTWKQVKGAYPHE